jgi:hypothetical protein
MRSSYSMAPSERGARRRRTLETGGAIRRAAGGTCMGIQQAQTPVRREAETAWQGERTASGWPASQRVAAPCDRAPPASTDTLPPANGPRFVICSGLSISGALGGGDPDGSLGLASR